jgi:hypothetical protein
LHDFLAGEDEWDLIQKFQRTSFFRRTRETVNVWDWADQNINKRQQEAATNGRSPGLVRLVRQWLRPKRAGT